MDLIDLHKKYTQTKQHDLNSWIYITIKENTGAQVLSLVILKKTLPQLFLTDMKYIFK